MESLEMQFSKDIRKKIQSMCKQKMDAKMLRAAKTTMKAADRLTTFHDVTGNLWKSIGAGVYYKGELHSIVGAKGPEPTRPSLEEGERYDLPRYYGRHGDGQKVRKAYVGEYGYGDEDGASAAEDLLYSLEGQYNKNRNFAWQLKIVAGVSYAGYVEVEHGCDVLSSLNTYLWRYFRTI